MVEGYVPEIGHIVWLSLEPHRGREQAGRRPFLVLTPRSYNDKTSLAVGCPITTRRKGYPFEVLLPASGRVKGVVLADQVKSLDWRERAASFGDLASARTLRNTRSLIGVLLGLIEQ